MTAALARRCALHCLLQAGPSYVGAFLTVLKNVTKDETVQYVLALVEEMLAGAAGGLTWLGQAGPLRAMAAARAGLGRSHCCSWRAAVGMRAAGQVATVCLVQQHGRMLLNKPPGRAQEWPPACSPEQP